MKMKWLKSIRWLASRKRRMYTFAIALALSCVLVVIVIQTEYDTRCKYRIMVIQVHLKSIRNSIQTFFERNGRYPYSLDELLRYLQEYNSLGDKKIKMYVDLTSEKQSDVPEYREMNDKGGYYYDPNTGEIRLNLIRPVKEYLKWYRGYYKDQIPSTW